MVQVTYQGGGMDGVTSNAASEATLQLLLKALSGKGGGAGVQDAYNKAQNKGMLGQKALTKSTGAQTKATDTQTAAAKASAKAFKMVTGAVKGTLGMLVGTLGNVANTAANLGKELLAGGTGIGDFTKHISGLVAKFPIFGGMMGGAISTMVGMIEGQIASFRQLSNSGIDFGGSLFEIMNQSTKTGLSMEQFAGALSEGSQNLATMFGGASAGASRFAGLQRELKGSIGELNRLGVSLDEVGTFTNDYLEIAKISGRYQNMTDRQLAAGTKDYIMQLDQLAKVTGMTRKEAAEALRAQANDKRLQALYASLDDATRKSIDNTLAMMGNVGPEFKEGITELIATGGAPLSEYGKGLIATMPELGEASRQLKAGQITNEEFIEIAKQAQAKQRQMLNENGEMIGTYAAMGGTLYNASLDIAKAGEIGGKLSEAQQQQLDAQKNAERGLTEFESKITQIRNTILSKLIDSGVFDQLALILTEVADVFTGLFGKGGSGTKTLDSWFDSIAKWIDDVKNAFGAGASIGDVLKEYVWKPIKKALSNFWSGTGETTTTENEDGSTTTSVDKGLKGQFIDSLKSVGKYLFVGGLALGAIILAMSVAIGALAGPLNVASPGLLALGAAFAGIGVAAGGISLLIDAITGSVGKLADGAKKFEELDADQLKLVGGGLAEITGPIMDLAKGGIVANFVGSGAFKNLADGVKEFQTIDPSNLHAVGPALTSLHKGMSAFTGDGVLDSISKALGSLFGGSSGSLSDLAEDVKLFADVDSQGLKNIGDGLQSIANFIEAMDGANLRTVSKSLSELTKQLQKYQEEYSKMDADTKANLVSNFTSFGEGQKGAADKLDQLNNSVQMMLVELRKQTRGINTTADAIG